MRGGTSGSDPAALAHPQILWECFAMPGAAVLRKDCQVVLRDSEAYPHLNGEQVKILNWDGLSTSFVVEHPSLDGAIKVKAAQLQTINQTLDSRQWLSSDVQFGCLPQDVAFSVAYWLSARMVAALSTTCRAFRTALWLQPDTAHLWEVLVARGLGEAAADMAQALRPGVSGPSLHRTARAARYLFKSVFRVRQGGVDRQTGNAEVVACPCVRHLTNVGVGAQGAIRRRAGPALEAAVAKLPIPVPELSATLVPGGEIAKYVAMTVTEPPQRILLRVSPMQDHARLIMGWLDEIHVNLLKVVREAGLRSIAMPTLCTGGFGVPPHLVALAAVRAARQDFFAHPTDPVQVQVSCYEASHMPAVETIRDEVYDRLYMPSFVEELLETALRPAVEPL
mmetsp:Transcript_63235/g.150819  ORF Transcript_63235/g.150819 Transcript_63235/m.150819 type:complete len:394 (+) Transcript_63235:52-1233(+)